MLQIRKITLITTITIGYLVISSSCYAMSASEQHEALSVHNRLRAKHSSPALTWDQQLADYAERYAADCQFKHSHGEYGENLAAGYPTVSKAIQGWYNENANYDYNKAEFSSNTGHFTQLAWKSTTKLGCALVHCDGKNGTPGDYFICEYNPPGNITNLPYFKENVIAPT